MNRRDFLKGLAAAFVVPFLPSPDVEPAFNPNLEYGRAIAIPVRGLDVDSAVTKTAEILMADARQFLPKGTPFAVIDYGEMDYGFVQGMGWYYRPEIESVPIGLDPFAGRTVVCKAVA